MNTLTEPTHKPPSRASAPVDDLDLKRTAVALLDRWPSAGVAVAVVHAGSPAWFFGHGVVDVASKEPISKETVFRIGSITKTFTAVAVMQLWEQGSVDLDAPADTYLRTFRLVPAVPSYRPTVRQLLTHTGGVGYWRRLSDLLRPGVGSADRAARSGAQPLAEYYQRGLPVEIEPGTKWVYSNHGFAALGQIVEDVTGQPLDRHMREHIFDPLGMEQTDLARSDRVRPWLATGYVLRSRGLKPVVDRELPAPGAGGAYSSLSDVASFVSALQRILAGEDGSVLRPATVASMFRPHFQLDPRLPGMGLAFELGDESGHKTVGKSGIVSGFLSAISMAPDDGIGVVVLSNTGGLDPRGVSEPLATALVRRLLGLPGHAIRTDVPPCPDTWGEICGYYSPDPGPVTNLFTRATMGAGAEVTVRRGQLVMKPLHPVPAIRRGMRLHPDDPDDPWVFRVEFSDYGFDLRVVFRPEAEAGRRVTRLLTDAFSFQKRAEVRNPRRWADGLLLGGAAVIAARARLRRRRSGARDGPG